MIFVNLANLNLLQEIKEFELAKEKPIYLIHIPKSSGSSLMGKNLVKVNHAFNIPKVYRLPGDKGGNPLFKGPYFPKYKYTKNPHIKIAIIRNPFSMLVSYYFHMEKKQYRPRDFNRKELGITGWGCCNYTHKFKSFEEFIRSYCNPNFDWHVPLFKQFLYSQLFDEADNCVADLLIKFEHLNESLPKLRKFGIRLDRHQSGKVLNKSTRKKDYKEYYTPELIKLVEEKCKKELETFKSLKV
tara:strand:+ start:114 stop:839 length:726 start_codon:yes stop_codon:yes gene_type:complete